MDECVANGIELDFTAESTDSRYSRQPTFNTGSSIPSHPVDILQKASADLLGALVDKDALDREGRLLVAVGTLRTCLDVHFVPHPNAWTGGATDTKSVSSTPVLQLPVRPPLSIQIPKSSGK
jgi:hypothetical protein